MLFGPNTLPFGLEMLHFGLCLLFSGLEACCLLAWRRRLPAPECIAFCPGDVAFWPHICHLLALELLPFGALKLPSGLEAVLSGPPKSCCGARKVPQLL